MEHETVQRRSSATVKNMGVNSYSQIISAFRAQGDLTEDQLNILPVLQNTLGISRERHSAEIKRALYDEQLSGIAASINPSSDTTNWEVEADYNCSIVAHRPPDSQCIRFAEHVLQTTPPTTIIQHQLPSTTTQLNPDLRQLVNDERKHDGVINATQQQRPSLQVHNIIKPASINTDLSGSKVIRLVRAKQATKRKSSLDTLIEVVQKELLRVNGQSSSTPPPSSPPSQTRLLSSSKLQNRISQSAVTPHRSSISSVLPSSHPASLTSQSNHSFKIARKRGTMNFHATKRLSSLSQRHRSFSNEDDEHDLMDHEHVDETQSGPENIEEIVRDTVDQLVAITIVNTAPYVVNMLTATPNNGNGANTEPKVLSNTISTYSTPIVKSQSTMVKSEYFRTDLTSVSTSANDLRHSVQQTSPMKPQQFVSSQQQQQLHHPQLIIQPATTAPLSTLQGTTTPTLLVAPRILNFQTVVPKPTTNIQIGNTKIILVSPSNITQHQPHSTTSIQPMGAAAAQQQSPVKLVKFTTASNNNNTTSLTTRATTLPIGTTQGSTLTLPKNMQIVIPSHTPSAIQLTRPHHDDSNRSMSTATTFRPVTTVPMTLTTCGVDQIPQAAQEVTVTTSPTSSPPLTTNASDLPPQASLGTPTNPISSNSKNQSPTHGTSQYPYFLMNTAETNQNTPVGSTVGKLRRRSSSSAPTDKPVGKILRSIAKVLPVYSPNTGNNHASVTDSTTPLLNVQQQPSILNVTAARASPINDDMIKSVAVNFQTQPQQLQRPPSAHGPMIYRMTSVNPNVPVFRVRATTAPTSTTVMNTSIKTDAKPISVTTASSMCYEPKPAHNTSTTGGSVSVLACFKTTKKRNKERAIMPRPSATDLNDTSGDFLQQRSQTSATSNASVILTSDITNSNASPDYRPLTTLTPTRLVQQTSLSSTLSDDLSPNVLILSAQEQTNDTTTSSSNSIPIARNNRIESNSVKVTTTTPNVSPPSSPLHSTPKPSLQDKSIQCIDNDPSERQIDLETTEDEHSINIDSQPNKRSADEDHWTVTAESLLRDLFSQASFQLLDERCQQNLSTEFHRLQSNLATDVFSSKDQLQNEILELQRKFLEDRSSDDRLEKLFDYVTGELSKICEETNESKRLRRE